MTHTTPILLGSASITFQLYKTGHQFVLRMQPTQSPMSAQDMTGELLLTATFLSFSIPQPLADAQYKGQLVGSWKGDSCARGSRDTKDSASIVDCPLNNAEELPCIWGFLHDSSQDNRCATCNMAELQKKGLVANKTLLKQAFRWEEGILWSQRSTSQYSLRCVAYTFPHISPSGMSNHIINRKRKVSIGQGILKLVTYKNFQESSPKSEVHFPKFISRGRIFMYFRYP